MRIPLSIHGNDKIKRTLTAAMRSASFLLLRMKHASASSILQKKSDQSQRGINKADQSQKGIKKADQSQKGINKADQSQKLHLLLFKILSNASLQIMCKLYSIKQKGGISVA